MQKTDKIFKTSAFDMPLKAPLSGLAIYTLTPGVLAQSSSRAYQQIHRELKPRE